MFPPLRYVVVYRYLGSVLVMAIGATGTSNTFSLLSLVSAMSRAIISSSKAVEVTPDKVERRYAEVS
jgi:hypothetical protein